MKKKFTQLEDSPMTAAANAPGATPANRKRAAAQSSAGVKALQSGGRRSRKNDPAGESSANAPIKPTPDRELAASDHGCAGKPPDIRVPDDRFDNPIYKRLRDLHLVRANAVKFRIKITNGLAAACRSWMTRNPFAAALTDDAFKATALKLVSALMNGEEIEPQYADVALRMAEDCVAANQLVEHWNRAEAKCSKEMEALVKQNFPAMVDFVKAIPGVSIGTLASILGITGDMSKYRNKSCVNKRLALHLFKNKSLPALRKFSGNAHSNEKATAEDWNRKDGGPGQKPENRTPTWNGMASMIRACGGKSYTPGENKYVDIYYRHKPLYLEKFADQPTRKSHADRAARMVAEKAFVADLYKVATVFAAEKSQSSPVSA